MYFRFVILIITLVTTGCVGDRNSGNTFDANTGADTSTETRCLLLNGEGVLEDSGLCRVTRCDEGFFDCDDDSITGCETALDAAPNHCGACGVSCAVGETCGDGVCLCGNEGACGEGEACCQGGCVLETDPRCACGDQAAGCEAGQGCCDDTCVDILANDAHCGACGLPCGPNQQCNSGGCVCIPGFADCDNDPTNGCEVNTDSELSDCGACGVTCGSGESCQAGECVCGSSTGSGQPACGGGDVCCGDACVAPNDPACACGEQPNCNNDELCCNNTCTAIRTDEQNCGACGTTCQGDTLCRSGSCECPSSTPNSCPGNSCVSFLTDENNCGGCGRTCSGSQTCCSGSCVNTNTSNLHCGTCGNSCGSGYCYQASCAPRPTFTADPSCSDLGEAHSGSSSDYLTRYIVRGRPGATVYKWNEHLSCRTKATLASESEGGVQKLDSRGELVFLLGNASPVGCTDSNAIIGEYDSWVVVDGIESNHDRSTYYNSGCSSFRTCTQAKSYCGQ